MRATSSTPVDLVGLMQHSTVVLNAVPDPLFVKDAGSVYLWANQAWADLMALEHERIAGSRDADLFDSDLAVLISEPDSHVLDEGVQIQRLIDLHVPGRPCRRIQFTVSPIPGPDGTVSGLVGAATDVTDRMQASSSGDHQSGFREAMALCTRSLLMSRTTELAIGGFLRHLGEINQAHAVTVFENFTTREGDLWFTRRYEWTHPDCRHDRSNFASRSYGPWLVRWHDMLSMGMPIYGTRQTLPPEESAVLAEESIETVLVLPLEIGRQLWGFIRIVHCEDTHGWEDAEMHVLAIAAESLSAFLMRVHSEEALRRKMEEQQALWKGTPDLLYIKDRNLLYVMGNPAFAHFLGIACDEIPGKTDRDIFPPELAAKFNADDRRVIESGEILSNIEESAADAAGRTVHLMTTKAPLRDSNGDVIGIISITRDVTERTELEYRMRQAQKMESIGTLAAGIAHDFNNILTAILGFAGLALPKVSETDPVHRFIDRIATAGTRAKDLIRQLLTFSRQVAVQKQPMAFGPILKEAVKFLRSTLPANIEIAASVPDALPPIEADPTQMHQVVMNLCVNAAHAMPGGGVLSLRLDTVDAGEPPDGDLPDQDAGAVEQWVQLTVEDTGDGMDDATKARIFEPFFTTKEPGKGTGLGLSTVYGIVNDSGGTIDLESAPGRGTTFRVRFPATPSAAIKRVETSAAFDVQGSEIVLFVDDEPDIRELGRTTLEEAGYTVLTAAEGAEALSIYEQCGGEIDLLIADNSMPRMSGTQLIHHVLLALKPGAKCILCSGQAIRDDDRRMVEGTGGVVIPKPFVPSEILAATRRALDA